MTTGNGSLRRLARACALAAGLLLVNAAPGMATATLNVSSGALSFTEATGAQGQGSTSTLVCDAQRTCTLTTDVTGITTTTPTACQPSIAAVGIWTCTGVNSVGAFLNDGQDEFTLETPATISSTLNGGLDADTITIGRAMGADSVTGGGPESSTPPYDVVSYAGRATGVTLTIAGAAANNTDRDSVSDDVEYVIGSDGADTLTGSETGERINGAGGNDTIDGRDGYDTLQGGEGDDTLNGGSGFNTSIWGGGADSLFGEAGNDTLIGDDATGTQGGDSFYGGAGADTFNGRGGADTIYTDDADRFSDIVACGDGPDSVNGDRTDNVAADCETKNLGPAPTITIADIATAVTEGSGVATFTLHLSDQSFEPVSVTATPVLDGSASDADLGDAQTATFESLTQTAQVSIPITADEIDEADVETFGLELSDATNATIADNRANAAIADDDAMPQISVSDAVPQLGGTIVEGGGVLEGEAAVFTVSLSNPSDRAITVLHDAQDGTAVEGADYIDDVNALTFAPGETSHTIEIALEGDLIDEEDPETFILALSFAEYPAVTQPASFADAVGEAAIHDDDDAPSVAVTGTSVTEGDSGTLTAKFTVTLGAESGRTVTVGYATQDATATAGDDYVATSDTLEFEPGETTKIVDVAVHGDTAFEADETFALALSDPVNTTLATGGDSATATITNDDADTPPPAAAITIDDVSRPEGAKGTKELVFHLTLSAALTTPVSVDVATANGTALAGSDYVGRTATVAFPAGQTTATFAVKVQGDTTPEDDETFTANLSNVVGAAIADAEGTGTILDDEKRPRP